MHLVRGRDYYDSALAYGRDESIVFVRETKLVDPRDCPLSHMSYGPDLIYYGDSNYGYRKTNSEITVRRNGFTTNHPIRSVTVYLGTKRFQGYICHIGLETHTFWQKDSLVHWIKSMGYEPNFEHSKNRRSAVQTLDEVFSPRDATPNELEWMVDNKVAIALYSQDVSDGNDAIGNWRASDHNGHLPWRCNAADPGNTLQEYGVMKAIDAFSAMQELSMYVGGIMGGNNPTMVQITDEKTLVKKHGFDKWSFRKMPEK